MNAPSRMLSLLSRRLAMELVASACQPHRVSKLSVQIQKVIGNLAEQYKGKDEEFENFKREYNIRPASAG